MKKNIEPNVALIVTIIPPIIAPKNKPPLKESRLIIGKFKRTKKEYDTMNIRID
tara:strand:+ start:100 stop:261 length:162 start_codon:yes stop_codon:yes gene_type:complete